MHSLKSRLRVLALILAIFGENPKTFSKTGISLSVKTFLIKLNIVSEQKYSLSCQLTLLGDF